MVNVHLASRQGNDVIEYHLNKTFDSMGITESDRIICGILMIIPTVSIGKSTHTPTLYTHMEFKGYKDFMTVKFHSTQIRHS